MKIETIPMIIMWVCIALIVLPALARLLQTLLVYRDDGHGVRHEEFHDEERAAGVSYGDRAAKLYLMEAMARLRRMSSNAVRDNPQGWKEALDKAKQDAFEFVALENPDLLPAFGGMVKDLSYGDILYPFEARMVDRLVTAPKGATIITEDQFAALRRVRPG